MTRGSASPVMLTEKKARRVKVEALPPALFEIRPTLFTIWNT